MNPLSLLFARSSLPGRPKVASEVQHFEGGAYRVTSIPDGLQIIQRGTKNANHLEIVPKKAMSMEDYQKLLSEVKLEKVE